MSVEGPMARSVRDVRLGLQAMCARNWRDPLWVPAPLESGAAAPRRVALVIDPARGGVHPQVAAGVQRAGELLRAAGYTVDEVEPPGIEEAADVWRVICIGELLTHLEPAVKDISGDRLRRVFGFYHGVLPKFGYDEYSAAFARRRKVLRAWLGFFESYDAVVAPIGTQPPLVSDADLTSLDHTLAHIHSFRMTVAVNALGLPSAVVPVGVSEGLPQAVQIIGPPFAEMRCLAVAEAIETLSPPLTPIDPA